MTKDEVIFLNCQIARAYLRKEHKLFPVSFRYVWKSLGSISVMWEILQKFEFSSLNETAEKKYALFTLEREGITISKISERGVHYTNI